MPTSAPFERVASAILPDCDEDTRRTVLEQLLHSAQVAAEAAPAAWAVTLFDNGFRLNVGPVETLVLDGRTIAINLAVSASDNAVRDLNVQTTEYKSMPAPQAKYVADVEKFVQVRGLLQPLHDAFVRKAATTKNGEPRQGSSYASSHSPELMEYAANFVGSTVPERTSNNLVFPFTVGSSYHRKDIFRVIGLPADPTGGNWFTGYTAHGDDWFIFCGVGTGGRTGHDYGNHFDGDRLVWFAKTNTNVNQASIQKLTKPNGNVYIFFREEDRDPFTFAGLGKAVEVLNQTPVKVIWSFSAGSDLRLPTQLPEEVDDVEVSTVPEGARRTVQVNVYERDPNARRKCIARWGLKCAVCSFDFSARYGELGEGFIHVHHLRPLGEIGEQYELNPVTDLRPVCPNCHAMLHRKKPALGIEDLKALLRIGD